MLLMTVIVLHVHDVLCGEVKQVAYKIHCTFFLYERAEDCVEAYCLCTSMESSANLTQCFHSGSH